MSVAPPLLAVLLQWSLWSVIRPYVWFLFYPAVFVSSWFGGRVAGLHATALSALLVWYLFIPPELRFFKDAGAPVVPVLVFLAMGVVFTFSHERMRRSEQRLRDLFDQAGHGIFVADLDGRYVDVNRAACRLLGARREDIVGKAIADFIPSTDLPRLEEAKRRMLHGETHVADWNLRRNDGSYLPVEVSAKILADGQWQAFVQDISDRRRVEAQLSQAAAVFDSTMEAIIVTDSEARIVNVNNAFTSMTGYTADEVLGRNPSFQQSGRQDARFYGRLWSSLTATGQWQGELWNRRKGGELFPVWESISVVRDAAGAVSGYVSILTDITRLKQAEERLRHLANHDPLTGLPNRLLFVSSLQQSIERAKRHRTRMALIFIDLDRFKLVNDSMGHAAGDELLKEVGHRLKKVVRAEDVVCRLGGDEFTVVIEDVARVDDVATLAQKIISSLALPILLEGRELVVSASLGIALYPEDAEGVDELSRAADAAMYRAKEQGRNTFEFYTAEITDSVREQLAMEMDLRAALERNELTLHYQPQFDLSTMSVTGVEALLRWQHPKLGLLMPDRFVPVAEQTSLINALGAWVLQRACAQLRAWVDAGLEPIRMAINVSGRQVMYDHLVASVGGALEQYSLQDIAACVELELTESVLQTVEPSAEILNRLRSLGVRIAIDDFGVGYSSLGMLRHLPIDALKIDRSFIRNMPDDVNANAIVKAVISMAHALGLRVVAEGVETAVQLECLRELGCDDIQGFLLGIPMPAGEFQGLLQAAAAAPTHGQEAPPSRPVAGLDGPNVTQDARL
ncbi:EAL domain-containing protein [Paucibacter sp. JuS9]|uniref:EAL domain-containing protein n=1 Tax=Roseateles TaxID=93681 RepID=UPI002FE61CEF